ncbi:MAG: AAA family ATPase [Verrucomicrobiota bacterium]
MSSKRFRIAFSFAGEKRNYVKQVADLLAKQFGEDKILYDKFYEAKFAKAGLAFSLPELYHTETDLIVTVFCQDYDKKEWCGLEWNAIYGLIKQGKVEQVMLTRFNRVEGKGLYGLAGFIELDEKSTEETARLILERLADNEGKPKDYYTKPAATAAPVLKTSIPHNLPTLQPFFGREEELKKIAAALDPRHRGWGTLIDGDGGRGKTSLAVYAAYQVPHEHFEQIVFVSVKKQQQDDHRLRDLGSFALSSWQAMLGEIARRLDLRTVAEATEDQRARVLSESLTGRHILLLLDNLETLTENEQDELFAFLDFLPLGNKALLTSRIFVGNRVHALDLPALDRTTALQMLAEIAAHNAPFAASTEAERLDLIRETQGNALLLRWVAGQVGHGGCANIADALTHLRSCPDRNNALAFVFGDIIASLPAEDVAILATLTHVTRTIRLEDIASLSGVAEAQVINRLKHLRNRSLITADEKHEAFALVPMVADFLRKKKPEVVAETGDRLEKRAYALIVENGYRQHTRFPTLDAAWPSVAPALPRFLAGPSDRLQTLCSALDFFLDFTGRWDELLSLNQQAEVKAVMVEDHRNAGWRAYQTGWVYYLRRQADEVLAQADRAAQHWEKAFPKGTDPQLGTRERAVAIQLRGIGHNLKKDFPAAIAAYHKVVELDRSLSAESSDVATDLNTLANAEKNAGDLAAAERDYREALRVAHAVGYAEGVANYTGNLSGLALDRKDWPAAEKLAREALPLTEKLGRQELIASNCYRLAKALLRQEKNAEGLPYARRAVEIFTRLGVADDIESACAILQECELQ